MHTRPRWVNARRLVVLELKGVRMPWSVGRVAVALSILPLLWSCGGGGNTPSSSNKLRVCAPDTGYSCTRFNCTGYQRCLSDGSGYSPCVCDGPNAGSGSDEDGGVSRPVERCGNGKDDDGDGRLDCDDADCSNMRCSPAAPSGWQGPVMLGEGAEAACAGNFDQVAFQGGTEPSGAPASCSKCTCSGSSCSEFVDFVTSDAVQCGGTSCATSFNQSCGEISPACLQGSSSAFLKTQLPSQTGCKASAQEPKLDAATWKSAVKACSPAAVYNGGCPSNQVCMPSASGADADERLCIWREGDERCPDGKYSGRRVLYRELSDSRGCSACSCKAPACDYRWRVFNADDQSCANPVLELKSEGLCVQVNPNGGKLRVGAALSGGGSCEPAGGEADGEVTADAPVTVCCAP